MFSKLQIFNMALGLLGTKMTVADEDEDSAEALACRTFYDLALETALAAHDWNFARRYVDLAELSVTPPNGWAYAYGWPAGCARFRHLTNGSRLAAPHLKWEAATVLVDEVLVRAILTDVEAPEGCYTAILTETTLFPPSFTRTVAAALAADIALPLTQKTENENRMQAKLQAAIMRAAVDDGNEGVTSLDDHMPDWLAVRGVVSDE